MKRARVHHAARRRGGGVAARGARAAGRARAAHRRAPARSRGRCGISRPASGRSCRGWSNWAGPSAATCGSTPAGPRANAAEIRRHAAELVALAPDVILAHGVPTVAAVAAGDPHRADRVPDRRRSGRRRLRRQPGAAGRQRHRFHRFRIRHEREMAGAAQADRARRDASGGPSGSRHIRPALPSSARSRPWRRRSGWR